MTNQPMSLSAYKNTLASMIDGNEFALPSNVPATAFRNAAIVAYTDNPKIGQCEPMSIFRSLRELAVLGLVPDGREAALVPFFSARDRKMICQPMPMVWGLARRARNSGEVKQLWADVIYEGETVPIWIEDGEKRWAHTNSDGSRLDAMTRGGKVIGAIAGAKLADGSTDFEAMTLDQIEKRRAVSRSKGGPWQDWYDEMCKKTVMRALCNRLPMSADDRRAITATPEERAMVDISPAAEPVDQIEHKPEPVVEIEAKPEAEPEPAVVVDDGDQTADKADPAKTEGAERPALPPHLQSVYDIIVKEIREAPSASIATEAELDGYIGPQGFGPIIAQINETDGDRADNINRLVDAARLVFAEPE